MSTSFFQLQRNVVSQLQTDKLESNMERAIRDYRVMRSDADFEEDTNKAVENVQRTVCRSLYGTLNENIIIIVLFFDTVEVLWCREQ